MKKVVSYTALCFGTIGIAVYLFFLFTRATVETIPPLKNGDIVFQTMNTPQSMAIVFASNTVFTHVGVVKINKTGEPMVIEAVGPVKTTPFNQWIRQGMGGRIAIKRMRNLTEEKAEEVLEEARTYLGRPYDVYFLFGDDAIYCSELVYKAFQKAGIELGTVQIVKDLNVDNFAVRNLIKKRWKNFPACIAAEQTDFEGCYTVIMKQKIITPHSIAQDKRLEMIYSNYPVMQ